jgi:hypothetical protein
VETGTLSSHTRPIPDVLKSFYYSFVLILYREFFGMVRQGWASPAIVLIGVLTSLLAPALGFKAEDFKVRGE